MAKGGYDPERIGTNEMREALEADRNVEFMNRAYDDSETSFNTSAASNLSTDEQLDLGRPPNVELDKMVIELAKKIDAVNKISKLSGKKLTKSGEYVATKGILTVEDEHIYYRGTQITNL